MINFLKLEESNTGLSNILLITTAGVVIAGAVTMAMVNSSIGSQSNATSSPAAGSERLTAQDDSYSFAVGEVKEVDAEDGLLENDSVPSTDEAEVKLVALTCCQTNQSENYEFDFDINNDGSFGLSVEDSYPCDEIRFRYRVETAAASSTAGVTINLPNQESSTAENCKPVPQVGLSDLSESQKDKIDGRLILEMREAGFPHVEPRKENEDGESVYGLFIQTDNPDELRSIGVNVGSVSDDLVTANATKEQIIMAAQLDSVTWIDPGSQLRALDADSSSGGETELINQ